MAFSFRGFGGAALAAFAALTGLVAPAALCALTFTVDSTADVIDADVNDGVCSAVGGGCTLRAAVMQANVLGSVAVTIQLPAGLYLLSLPVIGGDSDAEGDLDLQAPSSGNPLIQISGAGAATTFIDPVGLTRALDVAAGRTAAISGVTIRNGLDIQDGGGGIRNAGVLTMTHCVIHNNGGSPNGGGIQSTGTLTVSSSILSSNAADFQGGAIWVNGGSMTLTDSLVEDNSADADGGGGLRLVSGTMLIDRTTLRGNSTGGWGGGVNSGGNLVVRNSTISDNHTANDGGGLIVSGAANIYNSSILFNEADADADVNGGSGGGVYNSFGTVNIRNTLIAGNYRAGLPAFYSDCFGTIGSYGMNLFTSPASICTLVVNLGSNGYLNSLSTIGPLQGNGGPTPTHALLAGSSAIDGTLAAYPCVNEASQPLLTDQRGVTRTLGLRCDVGAFEFSELFSDGFESGGTTAWI